ncbi:MAG: hypothetical protein CMI90_06945 [Pelagibacteraceae bacterium]|nr:hypothetical protein [Pelagibacteraceae bacterium]
MKPLLPNTFIINNKHLSSILSPGNDIIDYNSNINQVHRLNLLQILRPDIYFRKELSDKKFYDHSKKYYQELIDNNFISKRNNSFQLYKIHSKNHSQVGLVTLMNINDYKNKLIKPHEKILVTKGKERADQLKKVKFQICPIYLFFDDKKLKLNFNKYLKKNPIIYFKSGSYSHSIYESDIDFNSLLNFKELFIADGHHRIEGFSKLNNKKNTLFLAVIFPKSQCNNLPYNRSVKFPKSYDKKFFLTDLKTYFNVKKDIKPNPKKFQIYFQGDLLSIKLKSKYKSFGADCLDFSQFILKFILGIKDETKDERVEFVPPSLGDGYLKNQVDSGINDISSLMRHVDINLVIDFAKKKKFMPPKATWFEPKPLDGIFYHNIE